MSGARMIGEAAVIVVVLPALLAGCILGARSAWRWLCLRCWAVATIVAACMDARDEARARQDEKQGRWDHGRK